jgi:hypothetical protein
MVTKGRYQTVKNANDKSMWKFFIRDTDTEGNSSNVVCVAADEQKADHVASALNFNNKPSEYGYKLVD